MSNKTLGEPAKKTASAPKKKIYFWVVIAAAASLAIIGLYFRQTRNRLTFGNQSIQYIRAATPEDRTKGLAEYQSLSADQAMLFVFEEDGNHCFWMKDMKFPIDMIWLDGNKRVVKIESDVQPDSYPMNFCPNKPVRYVIEINAGQAKQAEVAVGSQLQF